jgi:deoxyribonuclease-1
MHAQRPLILAAVFLLAGTACAEHDGNGQRIADYKSALPLMWGKLYAEGGETLYCARGFGKKKGRRINVEHVFPMSWVAWTLKCGKRDECRDSSEQFNRIEADLHNLWPSRVDVNKARRSYPFGTVKGEKRTFKGCDFELDENNRVVEPRPAARGEIARSMFYMAQEYRLEIRARQGRTLQRWNRDDPPSDEERRRNDLIERIQGNRNPFIDDPNRADELRF